MAFWNKYPYTDFHELNLDWILKTFREYIQKIDAIDDNIEDAVIEQLQAWLLDGTMDLIVNTTAFSKLKFFYVPEDSEFPAEGDGITDCTNAFHQLCEWIANGQDDIRMIFIPANKTYRISTTIALPENSILFGAGETSIIYYDETNTNFGTALTNGGSNIVIDNVNIQHRTEQQITSWGAMTGAIGIGTVDGCGKITSSGDYGRKDNHNITIRNLYCTRGYYALQTEPDSSHTIKNVNVNGVYAPNSLVSIDAKNYDHSLVNVTYDNIYCDVLRAGNGAGINEGVSINGFYCKYLRASDTGITFNNGLVDGVPTTILSTSLSNNAVSSVKSGNTFNNVTFKGGIRNTAMYLYRISASISGSYIFNTCKFSDFTTFGYNTIGTGIGCIFLNDCYIDNTTLNNTIKLYVTGGDVPKVAGTSSYPKIYANELDSSADAVVTTPLTFVWQYSRIIGNEYFVSCYIDLTNYTTGGIILQFPSVVPAIGTINCQGFNSSDNTSRALHCTRSGSDLKLDNALGMDRILVNFTSPILI